MREKTFAKNSFSLCTWTISAVIVELQLYGILLTRNMLSHLDGISKKLQSSSQDIFQAYEMVTVSLSQVKT